MLFRSIQSGSTLADPKRFKFENGEFYLKTAAQMRALFSELPAACDNTLIIAERCEVSLRENENLLPQFNVPGGETEVSWLIKKSEAGLRERCGENPDQIYIERLAYELDVMSKMGFAGYFLVVADLVAYARSQNISVGPGRGSAAG